MGLAPSSALGAGFGAACPVALAGESAGVGVALPPSPRACPSGVASGGGRSPPGRRGGGFGGAPPWVAEGGRRSRPGAAFGGPGGFPRAGPGRSHGRYLTE